MPSKASEVRVCKDLKGDLFTIGSGNKGRDEDMIRTSMEKMALYICTEFSAKAAQEWTSGKQTVLKEPAYLQVVLARHAERVKATRDRLNRKLTSFREKRQEIEGKLAANPGNCSLRNEMHEVKYNIAKTKIELKDEIILKLTEDEMAVHTNPWITYQESSESLKKSRGVIYSLLLGQRVEVMVDKMKQDNNWVAISTLCDPNLLFMLIERSALADPLILAKDRPLPIRLH